MIKIKSILILILVFSFLYSGTDGTIRGQVTDTDGAPLIGAQIYIPQLGVGTTADIDGNYIILNIKEKNIDYDCLPLTDWKIALSVEDAFRKSKELELIVTPYEINFLSGSSWSGIIICT